MKYKRWTRACLLLLLIIPFAMVMGCALLVGYECRVSTDCGSTYSCQQGWCQPAAIGPPQPPPPRQRKPPVQDGALQIFDWHQTRLPITEVRSFATTKQLVQVFDNGWLLQQNQACDAQGSSDKCTMYQWFDKDHKQLHQQLSLEFNARTWFPSQTGPDRLLIATPTKAVCRLDCCNDLHEGKLQFVDSQTGKQVLWQSGKEKDFFYWNTIQHSQQLVALYVPNSCSQISSAGRAPALFDKSAPAPIEQMHILSMNSGKELTSTIDFLNGKQQLRLHQIIPLDRQHSLTYYEEVLGTGTDTRITRIFYIVDEESLQTKLILTQVQRVYPIGKIQYAAPWLLIPSRQYGQTQDQWTGYHMETGNLYEWIPQPQETRQGRWLTTCTETQCQLKDLTKLYPDHEYKLNDTSLVWLDDAKDQLYTFDRSTHTVTRKSLATQQQEVLLSALKASTNAYDKGLFVRKGQRVLFLYDGTLYLLGPVQKKWQISQTIPSDKIKIELIGEVQTTIPTKSHWSTPDKAQIQTPEVLVISYPEPSNPQRSHVYLWQLDTHQVAYISSKAKVFGAIVGTAKAHHFYLVESAGSGDAGATVIVPLDLSSAPKLLASDDKNRTIRTSATGHTISWIDPQAEASQRKLFVAPLPATEK